MRRLSFPTACALLLALASTAVPSLAQGEQNAPVPVPVQATVPGGPDPVPVAPVDGSITTPPVDSTLPATTTTTIPMVRWLELVGHGYGHGRGLGQWGALGYATDQGWTYDRILNYFYGGTGQGKVSPLSALGVRLTGLDDRTLTVFHPTGRLWTAVTGQALQPPPWLVPPTAVQPTPSAASDPTGSTVPGSVPQPVAAGASIVGAVAVPASNGAPTSEPSSMPAVTAAPFVAPIGPAALKIQLVSPGRFIISDGPGCGGPWTVRSTLDTTSVTVSVGPDPVPDPDDPARMLSVCQGASTRRVYRGDLVAVDGKPGQRAVNQVSLEDYVRGVVPGEVPPSWGNKPNGMEVLKAQAVAARSYSAAERRNGFSNTCDSDQCQVYRGRGETRAGTFTSFEDSKTDRAVRDTAGEVRVNPVNGAVIRTEFSSSTGGQSAPGDFPPVVDEGDATAANPYKRWTVSLSPTQLEAGRKLGAFRAIEITKRDGVGQYGGRVHNLRLVFAQGSVAMTSGEFLRKFNLRSTLFDVQVVERPLGGGSAAPTEPVADGTRTSPDTAVAAAASVDSTAPATTKATAKKKTTTGAKSTTTVAVVPASAPTTTSVNAVAAATAGARVQVAGAARTNVEVTVPQTTRPRPTTTVKQARR